jgi:hypothetical protein
VTIAMNPIPTSITTAAIIRPALVLGVTSPYPTVVIVEIDQYMPTPSDVFSTVANAWAPARKTANA